MRIPARITRSEGRYALVDGISFHLPVDSRSTPALVAAFPISAREAAQLLPGTDVHPLRLPGDRALLVITVVDYRITDIGRYIEFSIAIACTHGAHAAPALLPALRRGHYGTGQFVVDLPVSTEVSVKGGKGIWGMPKHQANLSFEVGERTVGAQYDDDGLLGMWVEIDLPRGPSLPMRMGAVNVCAFRGMLMKSYVYFAGKGTAALGPFAHARLQLGDLPRVQPLKELDIRPKPLFTAFISNATGVLDDHFEGWFLGFEKQPAERPEGFESVIDLGLGQEWLAPPAARHE